MDHSEHGENKHKIFKYTDKDGHVHYVDENGNPVKRRKPPSSEGSHSYSRSSHKHPSSDKKGLSKKRNIPEKQEKKLPKNTVPSPPEKKKNSPPLTAVEPAPSRHMDGPS